MKLSFLFAFLIFSLRIWALEEGQYLPDQIQDDSYYQETLKEAKGNSSFLEGGAPEIDLKDYPSENKKPLDDPNFFNKKFSKDAGHSLESTNNNSPELMEYKNNELMKEVHDHGNSVIAFGYFFQPNDVSDRSSVYRKTYRDSTGAQESGMIHLSGDKTVFRSIVEANLGANLGVSFAQGKGHFQNNQTESNANFSLWMVPLDISAGLAFPIGRWAKLRAAGGPSVMGLMQTRSDKKPAEKHKRRRQIGRGYFLEGQFDFSLSNLMPSLGKQMLGEYGITQYYLTAIIRTQKYSNFQDDIEVSGNSFGVLMTFEYF